MKRKLPLLFIIFMATACAPETSASPSHEDFVIDDMSIYVYENKTLPEQYTYTYEGTDIEINDNIVNGLKAATTTEVTAHGVGDQTATFTVKVANRPYTSRHETAETNENWFDEVSVAAVAYLAADFPLGVDVSTAKRIYDRGGRYYNREGNEQSLFQILKDGGVNYVRLRLWHDPYNYYEEGGEAKVLGYGGGYCDLDNVTWMAHEAKAAGLSFYLDFHMSDFWSDPSKQVIPKAWKDLTTAEEIATALQEYTTATITHLAENEAMPDIVSIGNEINLGLLVHYPGGTNTSVTGQEPLYISGRSNLPSAIAGRYTANGTNENLRLYMQAGIDGIKAVSDDIEIMIHYAKSFNAPDQIITFYNTFNDLDYDIIGLSGYSYWHFNNMSNISTGLTTVHNAFPNKKISIVETSYGFTYEADTWASNSFSSTSTNNVRPMSGYAVSPQGQAQFVRDVTNQLNMVDNSYGIFYWEGAWIPKSMAGWADDATKSSWANQGFFSYDGKALGSLEVFNQIRGV